MRLVDRTVAGRRLLVGVERLKRTHEGALWFVSRAWNWPGHHGTQTRVGRWKFTAIIERPKEAT